MDQDTKLSIFLLILLIFMVSSRDSMIIIHKMPTLILDRRKCLKNIEKMAVKAKRKGLGLRPHFKTHQSTAIGDWFRDCGVSGITVSSFRMAEYFAGSGWKDILVDSTEVLQFLQKLENRTPCYIDIDTGYGRTGVRSDDPERIDRIIRDAGAIKNLDFAGFYCHAGHSYHAGGPAEREEIHRKAISDLKALKDRFSEAHPRVLYGDTPGCSTQQNFDGIDTITPGNFVFYDLFQCSVGSCREEDIAVAMACPVVSKYPGERKLLIHGGAVHFSKEMLRMDGQPVYLSEISQEHGIIRNCPGNFDKIRIGDLLYLLPVHSCLSANLMGGYATLKGQKIGMMPRPG